MYRTRIVSAILAATMFTLPITASAQDWRRGDHGGADRGRMEDRHDWHQADQGRGDDGRGEDWRDRRHDDHGRGFLGNRRDWRQHQGGDVLP